MGKGIKRTLGNPRKKGKAKSIFRRGGKNI